MRALTFLSVLLASAMIQQPTFRSTTELVRIEVSVSDEKGPVVGLQARDFIMTDNGLVQQPTVEELRDTPLDLVAVVQPLESLRLTSESQAPRIRAAFDAFLENVDERDRLAVLLATAPAVRLRALSFGRVSLGTMAIEGRPYAAPFDAIVAGLTELVQSDRRRVLAAFTNAADFRSTVTFDTLVQQTNRLGTTFLLFGSPTEFRETVMVSATTSAGREFASGTATARGAVFPAVLKRLADRTGGLAVDLSKGESRDLIKKAFAWIRTRYLLSYKPPPGKGWHKLNVRVNRKGATVTARAGYYVE